MLKRSKKFIIKHQDTIWCIFTFIALLEAVLLLIVTTKFMQENAMFTVHYYDLRTQSWKHRSFQLISGAAEFVKRKKCLIRIERRLPSGSVELFSGPARKFVLTNSQPYRSHLNEVALLWRLFFLFENQIETKLLFLYRSHMLTKVATEVSYLFVRGLNIRNFPESATSRENPFR